MEHITVRAVHAIVVMQSVLEPNGHRRKQRTPLAVERLTQMAVHTSYEQELSDELRTPTSSNADEHGGQIKQAMLVPEGRICEHQTGQLRFRISIIFESRMIWNVTWLLALCGKLT